ncbi:MAG TPA: hypothetical protein VN887_00835 [Candidatus Angelobacter sp.]|nr:hypothetical protein [Candidatus Angelobacter sp.]
MNQKHSSLTRRLSQLVSATALVAVPFFFSADKCRAADAAPDSSQKPAGELAPLPLNLPPAGYEGTPKDMPPDTTAEKPSGKPRPPFLAPKGVKNVAAGRPVTSSDSSPISGDLKQITDGKKDAFDENVVTLRRRTQWVQVDLQGEFNLYAILLWHEHKSPVVYRDVIVQVSDDPEFKNGVHTLFNNDQDNSSGLGVGTDREYFENHEGKLIDAKGTRARYVRCYSKGNTDYALNSYTEIEVYALPAQ